MFAELWATEGVGSDGNESRRIHAESFQITYNDLRDDNDNTHATFLEGCWITPDGRKWSDICFGNEA